MGEPILTRSRYGSSKAKAFCFRKVKRVRNTIFLFGSILGLLLPTAAFSEVRIAKACRVANQADGRCGWSALETLARHHGITGLYGLGERYPANTRPKDLEGAVVATGAKYRIQGRGCRDTDLLRSSVRDNLGAIVGLRPAYPGGKGHIITLVDFGSDEVRYLDPNDKDREVRTMSVESFLERWDGFALVLERPQPKIAEPGGALGQ
jgi:hypothetical protein